MAAAAGRLGKTRSAGRKADDLAQADYARLAEFRYLLRGFLVFSEEAAQHVDLTAQQHQALLAIKARSWLQPMTAGALAERLAIRPHSAVGLIDRLGAKGLIRRYAASTDRRQVLIALTDDAEQLLRSLTLAHRREIERLAPLLRSLLKHFDTNP